MTLIKLLPSPNSFLGLTFFEGGGEEGGTGRRVLCSEVRTAQSVPNPVTFHLKVTAAQSDAKDKANLGYRAKFKVKRHLGRGDIAQGKSACLV